MSGSKPQAKLTQPAPLRPGHNIAGFDCGEEVLNQWLTKWALRSAEDRTANTFVVCRGRRVVAYYSLATASILHAHCTSNLRRNAPNPVPALLLARLAVAKDEQKNQIGRHLLQDAMRRCLLAARHVAARTLLVDALNDRAAVYYKRHGFLELPADLSGTVIRLHLPLDKIVAALQLATQVTAGAKAKG
jgi:predicted N-acetyltransferase YhbS